MSVLNKPLDPYLRAGTHIEEQDRSAGNRNHQRKRRSVYPRLTPDVENASSKCGSS